MKRTPIIIGNWKMQLTPKAAVETLKTMKKLARPLKVEADVVIAGSAPTLGDLNKVLGKNTKLQLGAQNVHWSERGAWTGEVSVSQVKPFVSWCLVGHSEQRATTHETDEHYAAKVRLLMQHDITPIICVGESAAEKEAGETVTKVTRQVNAILDVVDEQSVAKIVFAYEPIWAISSNGPKVLADPSETGSIMLLMRKLAAQRFSNEAADRLRIIYGGSVNARNVTDYVSEPGVDGALPGKASLNPREFIDIVAAVQASRSA